MENTILFNTCMGMVGVTDKNGYITAIFFADPTIDIPSKQTTPLLENAKNQLLEYFSGHRKKFDLPLCENGTEFQKKAWKALRQIPYGETRSYKQVAKMIGQPNASRAVGLANNKNPILIVTPCHRVIGSDGKLSGYSGGVNIKEKLLKLENK